MTYSVYQHWDPIKTCVVGRSYPPEFYSWITVPHVRDLFERIAVETEEDFQAIIAKLQSFGTQILRPDLPDHIEVHGGRFRPPPMTPRDFFIMIGQNFYVPGFYWPNFYRKVKAPEWPWYETMQEFMYHAESWQIDEVYNLHGLEKEISKISPDTRYDKIFEHIQQQGNPIKPNFDGRINGAMVSRIGRDLYFASMFPASPKRSLTDDHDEQFIMQQINQEQPHTRNHVVNTGGHGDGVYCPVCPGLIVSLRDIDNYADTFPGWEVLYLPNQSWDQVEPFLRLKQKNYGKWWIPGFEHDQAVIDTVETWLDHWVGYVEETVFDVNILIIDHKNVMVFNENQAVFDALDRYGITPHVVPFRHRYFWDGGIHCVTLDLDRQGIMQDYFPDRS